MPEPVTQQPQPSTPNAEIDALVVKHRVEIDRLQSLDAQDQQVALAALGVDPKALMQHYKGLAEESDKLMREDAVASKKTEALGWLSAAAATGGALAAGEKMGNKVVRIFVTPVIALTAGVMGVFAGSRLFSGNIRDKSRALNVEARNAFDREVAVALENRERETAAAASVQQPPSVAPRNPSFAAQAAADKAAVAAAEAQRA